MTGAAGSAVFAAVASAALVAALCAELRLAMGSGRRGRVARRLPVDRTGSGAAVPRAGTGAGAAPGTASTVAAPGVGPRLGPPRWLAAALVDADIHLDAVTAWRWWCLGVPVVVLAAFVVAGPTMAAGAAVVGAVGPAVTLRARWGRGDASLEAALPGALEAVARALRTGASLRQGVAEAAARTPGSLGRELRRTSTQAERGAPLVQALDDLAQRRPLPGVRLAVAALCLGAETGGAQAQAVDGVATTLRDRLAVLAEVRALSSQARISALVISLAPLGFGVFAATTDPRTATFLFHTGAGFALLAAGAALDGLGWLWMNRLSRVQP